MAPASALKYVCDLLEAVVLNYKSIRDVKIIYYS